MQTDIEFRYFSKKIVLSIVLGFYLSLAIGQAKEVYLNDDFVEITKAEFEKPHDPNIFYKLKFELDTLTAHIKVQRIKKGKVTQELLDLIRCELSTLANQPIPQENLLVINYYHGPDPCNSGDHSYTRDMYNLYAKKVSKLSDVSQFYVCKSENGTRSRFGKDIQWIHDKNGTIEKTFLPVQYPCGSFVLLDSAGNFYVQKGEYNVLDLLKLLKKPEVIFSSD